MTRTRPAVAADAEAVATLGRAAFMRQYEGLVDPVNYTWAAEQWYSVEGIAGTIDACASDPAAVFEVAERDGAILGFVQYDETGPQPELHRLYVAATARGAGVGSLLMHALHAQLPPGATYVLAVVAGNDAAVRFYRRHGLREEGTVSGHGYYGETAGIVFPPQARDFSLIIMRRAADA
jgi:ribosomal protein S18 acetylase RimI-like enzyme